MGILDLLNKGITRHGFERQGLTERASGDECLDSLPHDSDCLRILCDALSRLNAHESSRFSAWDSKAIAMLGVVGLLLGLTAVGAGFLSHFKTADLGIWVSFALSAFFWCALGFSFLALWNAFMATRPREFCGIVIEDLCDVDGDPNAECLLRRMTAMEMVAYKNNLEIINQKADEAIRASVWFFRACLCIFLFVTTSALAL